MLWAMRTWPQVIADLGSANVSSTGFGERSHIMLKEAMEYTDRHGSKATIRQVCYHDCTQGTAMLLNSNTYHIHDATIVLTAWAKQYAIETGLYTSPSNDYVAKHHHVHCKITARLE